MNIFVLLGAAGFVAPRHMKAIKETGNQLVAALDPSDSVGVIDGYFPESDFFTEFERFDRHVDKFRRKGKKGGLCFHVLPGSRIGKDCNIGQNVAIGPDVRIGNRCKIQNNVSVFKGVTIEDDVFCGPSMVFTNVYNPRAHIRRMDEVRPTLVKKGATLGANATIICGDTIGAYAFIGAGAVVTKDVLDYAMMAGNPARQIGWVCKCGEKLAEDFSCPACSTRYRYEKGALTIA